MTRRIRPQTRRRVRPGGDVRAYRTCGDDLRKVARRRSANPENRRYIRPARSARSHHVNMLTSRYFRLRSLGQLTLSSVAGETETTAAVRPRHLAVLTVLALS